MGNIRWVDALRVQKGEVIAFVGAGGKTTTMLALARELEAMKWRVLVTTTTKMWMHQLQNFHTLAANTPPEQISAALDQHGVVSLYGAVDGEKAVGIEPDALEFIYHAVKPDALLIEADGARGLPLKFPREGEPAIPSFATLVVPIASMQVIGQPLDEDYVMNATSLSFSDQTPLNTSTTVYSVRKWLLGGSGKNVPAKTRLVPILNGTPVELLGEVRQIARHAVVHFSRSRTKCREVVIGSSVPGDIAEVYSHVMGIVLAAGLSTRMGQPKVLMEWRNGETILDHVLSQIKGRGGVFWSWVITGATDQAVRDVVYSKSTRAHAKYNPDYATGEMLSSLKVGLRAMPENIGAALIVLGDQPSIKHDVVQKVLQKYAETLAPIVAPSYQMKRGHPILIDRSLWGEILALPDDGAARDVINAHANEIAYVNVDDDSILRDVDTPEAYQDERRRAGLI